MENVSANLNILINSCQKISRFILRDFGEIEQLQTSVNGANNFTNIAVQKIEKILIDILTDARPKYGIISRTIERKGLDISHKFIINVEDGINNLKHGLPFFSISIALQEQKKIIASIIYIPILDKMFYAESGFGSYVSESRMVRRIRVSSHKDLFNSTIAEVGALKHFSTAKILNFDSVGLSIAYTSGASINAYIGFNQNLFDLAAGVLLIKEAGGFIVAYDENKKETNNIFESKIIVCTNNYLQQEIKKHLLQE